MYKRIVKVISCENNREGSVSYGTGILLNSTLAITSAHVVNRIKNFIVYKEQEYQCKVEKHNEIALLFLDSEIVGFSYSDCHDALFFTSGESLERDSEWTVYGYVSDEQAEHIVTGVGFTKIEESSKYDLKLKCVESGELSNYYGLSGAPVICNNRIVAIAQFQKGDLRGQLGIYTLSVESFSDWLPKEVFREPEYIEDIIDKSKKLAREAIKRNIESKKYIPELFVDESSYKEYLRYFAEPELFIFKIIDKIRALDFSGINIVLDSRKIPKIDLSDLEDHVEKLTFSESLDYIQDRIKKSIAYIDRVDHREKSLDMTVEGIYQTERWLNSSIKYALKDLYDDISFLKYKALLLTKEAGKGKTNFLCDFTENFLLKKGFICLYYNAYSFAENPKDIIKEFLFNSHPYDAKYMEAVLSQYCLRSKKPIIIVIDGLNENNALSQFGIAISSLVRWIISKPYIKIIMSTRNELLEYRFKDLTEEEMGPYFYRIDMQQGRRGDFSKRLIKGYFKHFNIDVFEFSDNAFITLADNPLLLRFFCEVNEGRQAMHIVDIYKYSLFENYYKKKEAEYISQVHYGETAVFRGLISKICNYMVANIKFTNVPEEIFSIEELRLMEKMVENDVLFKEEKQIKKGLLGEEISIVISFTFDEFRDYCIIRNLLGNTNEDDISSLLELWHRMCIEDWVIREGVEKYMFFLGRTLNPRIISILETEESYKNVYWDNIWELEDKDYTEEDIDIWKEELYSQGKNVGNILRNLLARRDRSYFTIVNVDVVFSLLDEISRDISLFTNIINEVFRNRSKDKYGVWESESRNVVFFTNRQVDLLMGQMNDTECVEKKLDFLRLTLYLYTLYPEGICNLWIQSYRLNKDAVRLVIDIFANNGNLSVLLREHTFMVLTKLCQNMPEDEYLTNMVSLFSIDNEEFDVADRILKNIWEE